jgi:Flp pilus assembly pilin Flp
LDTLCPIGYGPERKNPPRSPEFGGFGELARSVLLGMPQIGPLGNGDPEAGGHPMSFVARTLRNDRGQGMTEYIIIAILVALVVLFTVNRFGGALRNKFTQATNTTQSIQVTDVTNQSSIVTK